MKENKKTGGKSKSEKFLNMNGFFFSTFWRKMLNDYIKAEVKINLWNTRVVSVLVGFDVIIFMNTH